MTESIKENKYAYVIAIACCMVVFGGAGLVFSCASVFYAVVADAFGVGKGTFSIYMSIVCFVMSFSLPVMGKLAAKMHIKAFVAMCGAFIAVSFVLFAIAPNMIVIYIGAALQGFGVAGPMYVIVPTMINRWFYKKAGFFIGLAMAFTGGSAIVLMPVISMVIQNFGWRAGYWLEAILACIFMFIPALFMFKNDPKDIGMKPYGYEEAAASAGGTGAPATASVSLKTAMKSPTFFLMCVLSGAISLVTCINFYWTAYAIELGYALFVSSIIGSVAMYGQVIGKIGLGAVSDKSLKASIWLSYTFGIVGMLGALVLGASAGTFLILAFIFLYGITHAACAVETPVIARGCFGSGKDYSQIYSNIMAVGSFCSAIGSTLFGYLIDWTGGYEAVFAVGLVLCVVCLVAAFAAVSSSKKLERDLVE